MEEDFNARLELHREKLRLQRFRPRMQRSTLSAGQAAKIRPFLDVAAQGQDVLISYDDFPRAPSTVYRLILDSFIWLMEYDQEITREEKQKYIVLRAGVWFEETEDGWYIRHKRRDKTIDGRAGRMVRATTSQRVEVANATIRSINWKEEFMKWLETGEPLFERAGILVGQEDLQFLDGLCKSLGYKNESTINNVKVQKS